MLVRDIYRYFNQYSDDERPVRAISLNSKECKPNSLFIALKGQHDDGLKYIDEAWNNGAIVVISECEAERTLCVPDIKSKLTLFSIWFYEVDLTKIKLIGVTGTNGKSSTAYYTHKLLTKLGYRTLLITTTPNIENSKTCQNTTPHDHELACILKEAIASKCDYVIMECSSIGISEHKLNGLLFDHVLLTNLKEDHLDYHKSKKRYHMTKIKFINECSRNCLTYKKVKRHSHLDKPSTTFIDKEDIQILKSGEFIYKKHRFFCLTSSRYDIYNLTLAIELVHNLGYAYFVITKLVKDIKPLLGRYEIISNDPLVIIDYAHSIDAFDSFVKSVRYNYPYKKLILVFGAGGNRDKKKRPIYGKIAHRYAHLSIICEDNSRNEDFNEIARMIVGKYKDKFLIVPKREMALKWALSLASSDVAICLIGKGPETYIENKGIKTHFDEREEVRKWLMR